MPSPFEASASLTGYLYQCRYALLEAVRRAAVSPAFGVRIEALDDVEFDDESGNARELLQLKHRLRSVADLADASVDLWKSLRIWCHGLTSGAVGPDVVLVLLTTGRCSARTACSYLRGNGRDPEAARALLDSTALTSGNAANREAYAAYRALSPEQKASLLARVHIADAAVPIDEVGAQLVQELIWAAPSRDKALLLVDAVEGWWFRRVVKHLTGGAAGPILGSEIDAQVRQVADQFKPDNLPIDAGLLEADVEPERFATYAFVRQLDLIDIRGIRLVHAMANYFRAFTQRSAWLRDQHLHVGDLYQYDRRLHEEWEHHFETMKDSVGVEDAESAKRAAARELYRVVHELNVPIRPRVSEPFVTRGSYQMLANDLRVGWHPEFLDRLRATLEGEPS